MTNTDETRLATPDPTAEVDRTTYDTPSTVCVCRQRINHSTIAGGWVHLRSGLAECPEGGDQG